MSTACSRLLFPTQGTTLFCFPQLSVLTRPCNISRLWYETAHGQTLARPAWGFPAPLDSTELRAAQDRTQAASPLLLGEEIPFDPSLAASALQRAASEQGRAALPWDPLWDHSRQQPKYPCLHCVYKGKIHVFLFPEDLPHLWHTQEQGRWHRGRAGAPHSGSVSDISPQPLWPEQPMKKPKDLMQDSKNQTKILGSFPSSSLHYLARAINFFLS